MKNKIISMIFYLFRVFPINNNKIVIASFGGKGYGSEGKAIADRLMEARNDLDIVWLVRNPDEKLPKDIRGIKFASIKAIYEQVTAKVWIDNRRKPGYVRKRRGQYYIHTWHGGGPCLKWVEKDASDTLPREYIEYAINDSKMANLMVSGSDWRTKNMRDSFWYDGEIAKCDLFKKN
ncbi:CDP-glycerol glycerophosphotransferase family protein [Hungatella sp.]|uniref:CDP-glycerol glycerophosphotransferase family protein n=1 Tax=Hungatella sp. TaxID=2613924 RepID=UPI0039A057B1